VVRGSRSRFAKDAILVAIALLILGAAYTAVLIVQRQSALASISRYNLTWSVSQAGLEVSRLYGTIAASLVSGSGVDTEDVDLRLSIVENRIQVLSGGEIAAFIATSPDLNTIVDTFHNTIRAARAELDTALDSGHPIRMMRLINTLNIPISRLAAAANAYSSNMEAQDRHDLNGLHWLLAATLGGITTCGLVLLIVMSWHNRLLGRAQDDVVRQNLVLKQRDSELQTRNHQFDAALNNMSQALCMTDSDGRLIVCNVRFIELFGLCLEDVRPGAKIVDMFKSGLGQTPFYEIMVANVISRQELSGKRRVSLAFTEQDEAGFALAISLEPMEDGGWVATFEDVSERRRSEARIHHMAHHDLLTGLGNRVWFNARLNAASACDGEGDLAILCIDLDGFKQVNDMYGHLVGDELLCLVGARLSGCTRQSDALARLGGDEFAILQTGVGQPKAAQMVAARVVHELGQPFEINGHHLTIGGSVGIAIADDPTLISANLLNSADIALYRAKSEGKGKFCFYEAEMGNDLRTRRQVEVDLKEAVVREEFEVFYQPLYDLASDRVCGFEALLRWHHPDRGLVSPSIFVPVAEEIGLITDIGRWVLRKACADAAAWPSLIKVAVNLSSVQFRSPDLVSSVQDALCRAGLPASRLELEITESVLLNSEESVLVTLKKLKALGIRLALDDFGTGYSSLSYLRSFPFDKVKIDRSFVQDIVERPDCEAIVRAITALAASLGMTTTAEGVENEHQLERLRALDCTEVQGFLFDRPKPVTEITKWFTCYPEARVNLRLTSA